MYHHISERAKRYKEHTVRLTQQLIRIPSFSLHEGAAADRVEEVLKGLEYDLVLRDRAGNIVGVIAGANEGRTVLLNSHLDTVRPVNEEAWVDSPFSGRVDGGRVFGLGAADCKGGLAVQILAGRLLIEAPRPLCGALVVGATVAEEDGSSAGLRILLEETLPKLDLKPDFAILGEPTGLAMCNEHDGWVDIDVGITGCHSQTLRQSVELMIQRLRRSTSPAVPEDAREPFEILESEFCDRDEALEATVRVRRRVLAGQKVEDCLRWVRQCACLGSEPAKLSVCVHRERRQLYTGIATEVSCRAEPWVTEPLESSINRARDALVAAGFGEVRVCKRRFACLGMDAAGSVLVNGHNIPTIGFGPGDEKAAYMPNESVDVESLVDAVFGTAVLAYSLTGAPICG